MKIFKYPLLVFMCLIQGPAHAEDFYEQLELSAIKSAKSRLALERRLELIESMHRHDEACRAQLAAARLPYSCYLMRSSAAQLGVKAFISQESLTEKCDRIARQTGETEISLAKSLPSECLKVAKARVRINRYKIGRDFD